jgi:hypothetical protein
MNLNDLFNEEKVRLDPKCWTGKKIGNPKTKMKGGVRVNNCVPAESVAEGTLDEAVGMIIKGAAISGPDDQDIADQIAAKTGGRVDSGSYGHHILITYPTTQDRAIAAKKIRKMFPDIELYKSGGNRNAIDEQGVAEEQELDEKWSQKYKSSINCANPRGFSQRAHCAGRNKNEDVAEAGPVMTPQKQAELRQQMDMGGEDDDARDKYGNLKRSTSPGLGGTIDIGGVDIPADAFDVGSAAAMGSLGGFKNIFGKSNTAPVNTASNPNLAQDIATGRNVGGKAIPSLGEPGKVVTNKTADNVLTKLGGKSTETTPGPKVTPGSTKVELDPFVDVPTYIRQGKPDPVTTPKPGTKPKIKVQPGETLDQAIQRTRAEQEFSNFLKGQGGLSFGTAGGGRGGQGGPTSAQATSGADQVPTVKLPGGQIVPDPARLSPSGNYKTSSNPEMDKIMKKWDQEQQSSLASSSTPKSSKSNTRPSKFLQLFGPDKMDEASRKKREQPEVDYDDEYDAMVARVKKLAGLGPMKTVYDPAKRQYRNMPTAQQPKVQPKK